MIKGIVFCIVIMVSVIVLVNFGFYERYGCFLIRKRKHGRELVLIPVPFFLCGSYTKRSYEKKRNIGLQKIASDLAIDARVIEWVNEANEDETKLEELPWEIRWFLRKKDGGVRVWTSQELREQVRADSSSSFVLSDPSGVAGAIFQFLISGNLIGMVLILFATQRVTNDGIYDCLYTAADAAALAAAMTQQTTAIEYGSGGAPSLWTITVIPDKAITNMDRLFRENLYNNLSPMFVNTHITFGSNQTPGYTDTTLNNYANFLTTSYGGTAYQNGIVINMPVQVDQTLTGMAMQLLSGQPPGPLKYTLNAPSRFPFLLYDDQHTMGYAP